MLPFECDIILVISLLPTFIKLIHQRFEFKSMHYFSWGMSWAIWKLLLTAGTDLWIKRKPLPPLYIYPGINSKI